MVYQLEQKNHTCQTGFGFQQTGRSFLLCFLKYKFIGLGKFVRCKKTVLLFGENFIRCKFLRQLKMKCTDFWT